MASTKLRETALSSPKVLYKFLLRECDRLPKDAQQFYKHSVKQVTSNLKQVRKDVGHVIIVAHSFKQHVEEPDQDRVRQIMEKAMADAKWIVNKYCNDNKGKTPMDR